MKTIILAIMLLPLTLFAYESNEEIDNLDIGDFYSRIAPEKCSLGFENFEDGKVYSNLKVRKVKRYDCSGVAFNIDSVQDCSPVVEDSCVKPTIEEFDSYFDAHKVKLKAQLAKRQAREARAAQRKALEDKLKDPAQRGSVDFESFKKVLFEDK